MELSTCQVGNVTPLQLAVQNNAVTQSGYGTTKGVALTIGNPPQFFSSLPAFDANNTWVTLSQFCTGTANYSCIANYGGLYTPPAGINTTNSLDAWNGTTDVDGTRDTYYNDDVQNGGRNIPGMPFLSYFYEDGDFTNPSALCLGVNSSFIDAAVKAGITPTKQWSYWPGNEFLDLNGLLVVGGYDADRAAGQFETFEVQDSRTFVDIIGLSWDNNINSTNLMPAGTVSLQAVLEPYMSYVSLPYATTDDFLQASGTIYDLDFDYIYPSVFAPTGNLTVTLSTGYKTSIPADDLFLPPMDYNDQGTLVVTNSSILKSRISQTSGLIRLGLPYMTQKLFVSDFDNGRFYMADAVKEDFGSKAKNLQPLCTGGPAATNTSVPTPGPTNPASGGSSTNVGAIAGGVGGGVGALILIGIILFFVRRRKKNRATDTETEIPQSPVEEKGQPEYIGTPPPKYPSVYERPMSSELPSPVHPGFASISEATGAPKDFHDARSSAAPEVVPKNDHVERYELDSEGKCEATSGPMDTPYDHPQHWESRRYDE